MIEFASIILKLTFFQGLIFSLIFIFNKKKNLSFILLGLFLLTSVGPNLGRILVELNPKLIYFPANFLILAPVILFLYTKSVLGVLIKKDYYHIIPGIIDFIFSLLMFIYPAELASKFYDTRLPYSTILFVYILPAYYIFYASQSVLTINKYKKEIPKLYSTDELNRLNWLKTTCYILIVANLFDAITSIMVINQNFALYAYLFAVCVSAFVIYWISVFGLNQKNLFLSMLTIENVIETNQNLVIQNNSVSLEKKSQSTFDEDLESKYQQIISFFDATKVFKNKEINLFMVADLLQMSYRDVSKLINNYGNKNFNQFINEFRIKEAQKLIKEDTFDKFNLSGIAEEVGFNSRSTFFAAFKSITGMTPIEFKNKQVQVLEEI